MAFAIIYARFGSDKQFREIPQLPELKQNRFNLYQYMLKPKRRIKIV